MNTLQELAEKKKINTIAMKFMEGYLPITTNGRHCRRQGNWNTSARCVIGEVH
jgi:hypothetical protein